MDDLLDFLKISLQVFSLFLSFWRLFRDLIAKQGSSSTCRGSDKRA